MRPQGKNQAITLHLHQADYHAMRWRTLMAAILAGAAMTLGFAPFGLWPLVIVGLAYSLYMNIGHRPRHAFMLGFAFGFAWFASGCYWLFISIHHYGGAPLWITLPLMFSGFCLLGLVNGCYHYLLARIYPGNNAYKLLLIFPASWVLWELLRAHLLSGFAWFIVGYSQSTSYLGGYAPWLGVYGISALLCFIAAAGVYLISHYPRYSWKSSTLLILCVGLIFVGGRLLSNQSWGKAGKHLEASMIQANIPQSIKWSAAATNHILDRYARMTAQVAHSQLIIWPEGAMPIFPDYIKPYIAELKQFAQVEKLSLLIGAPSLGKNSRDYFNSLILLGKHNGQYNKQHLVPFGEYFPWPAISHFILQKLHIPMSAFTPGAAQQPTLYVNQIPIAASICYEITFPMLALKLMQQRQLMVTVSDDSWFGDSIALAQHLQMAVMQSMISRRYQLFATNSGITALINPYGHIVKQAPVNHVSILSAQVTAIRGATPIMHYTYKPLFYLALLILIGGFWVGRTKR